MKKKVVIGILIVLIICLGIFLIVKTNSNKNIREDSIKFKEDYESYNGKSNQNDKKYRVVNINKDNPFVYKTEDEIVSMINNKETFAVYFGFNTCPWCRSVIEELIKVSKDLSIDTIYYVNVRPNGVDIRDTITVNEDGTYERTKEGTTGYNKLLELLSNVLSDYNLTDKDGNKVDVNEKRIYAPNVVSIVNGKAIKLETGIASNQSDAYMELTDEMKKETYSKFESVLKEIKSGVCNAKEAC